MGGSNALLPKVMERIDEGVGSARNVRLGVAHVHAPERAEMED